MLKALVPINGGRRASATLAGEDEMAYASSRLVQTGIRSTSASPLATGNNTSAQKTWTTSDIGAIAASPVLYVVLVFSLSTITRRIASYKKAYAKKVTL